MFRAIPTSNKILARRWEEHEREIHLSKLKGMKASIDSSTPPQFRHLRSRLKRQQLMEDRFTEIERENRILLEKMTSILNTKTRDSHLPRPRSLNRELRKRELLRVTAENQAILKRLQDKPASYNVQQWEEDQKRHEETLRLRCEYPYAASQSYRESNSSARQRGLTPTPPISKSLVSNNLTAKSHRSRTLTPLAHEKRLVLKRGINISERYFIVEVSTDHKQVWVVANDVESPESYTLEMAFVEALDVMGGGENYEAILSALNMENGELVLSSKGNSQ